MRNVILAAALAATFCLSQTSHAQQAGGGTGAGAPAGGVVDGTNAAQGPGATGAETQGGPPTTGSFSIQPPAQGTYGAGGQTGIGGAGQVGGGGQTPMGTGAPAAGAATGAGQTLYGPSEPNAVEGTGRAGNVSGTGGAGDARTGGAGGATGTGVGQAGASGDVATSSPRAEEPTTEGPASEDAQVELARLRAEVDRLRAELDEAKGVRRGSKEADTGTGGSGPQEEAAPQPIASAELEGRVSKVSKKSIEIIDHETGEPYVLRLNEDSRARRGQRRIPVTRIREGSEVRASFDLVSGDTYATQIEVKGKRRR